MISMTKYMLIGLAAAACALYTSYALAGPAADAKDQFTVMDANQDGKVSPDEHAAGARTMFLNMDSNKDGSVTAEEMTAAHGNTDMSAQDKIKVVDTNGDGKLAAAEHAKGSAVMFTRMDSNGDGALTRQELTAGHSAMLRH